MGIYKHQPRMTNTNVYSSKITRLRKEGMEGREGKKGKKERRKLIEASKNCICHTIIQWSLVIC